MPWTKYLQAFLTRLDGGHISSNATTDDYEVLLLCAGLAEPALDRHGARSWSRDKNPYQPVSHILSVVISGPIAGMCWAMRGKSSSGGPFGGQRAWAHGVSRP
jgi:hypothetical protein